MERSLCLARGEPQRHHGCSPGRGGHRWHESRTGQPELAESEHEFSEG